MKKRVSAITPVECMRALMSECRYFTGEKPCFFHKEEGVVCGYCAHYAPLGKRILIIKLGAAGDVLRTTPLLTEIKRRDPAAHITWVTKSKSLPLLDNNPFIDRLFEYSVEIVNRLLVEEFDLVLNLDNAQDAAALASVSKGKKKRGYGLSARGNVTCLNPEAEQWLCMAVSDDRKKANTRTYQEHIFDICGYTFDPLIHEIVLPLREEEKVFSIRFAREHGIQDKDQVVGVNIGSGIRWPKKRWREQGFVSLIGRLTREHKVKCLLLGGPEEKERAGTIKKELQARGIEIIDGGCDNTLRQFIAMVDLCRLVVTGDSLALHIAVGLKKKVVALFGPTSAAEIELYGRGVKITPALDCLCCYREKCSVVPDCMESIRVDDVLKAVVGFVGSLKNYSNQEEFRQVIIAAK